MNRILRLFITISFPVLLVLVSVRLVMTPAFLHFEYNRPGFPADFYGFTREDRLEYAPYAIEYLFNAEDISYLGDLTFPDGSRLFNSRELHHMRDVKVLTQYTFGLAIVLGLVFIAVVVYLWRSRGGRGVLRQGLFNGSLLTLGIIAAVIFAAVISWDVFFTGFHTIFFEADTWYFAYSDTLIRLFPEQFWFDAALLVGGLTIIVALVTIVITWRWGR